VPVSSARAILLRFRLLEPSLGVGAMRRILLVFAAATLGMFGTTLPAQQTSSDPLSPEAQQTVPNKAQPGSVSTQPDQHLPSTPPPLPPEPPPFPMYPSEPPAHHHHHHHAQASHAHHGTRHSRHAL